MMMMNQETWGKKMQMRQEEARGGKMRQMEKEQGGKGKENVEVGEETRKCEDEGRGKIKQQDGK